MLKAYTKKMHEFLDFEIQNESVKFWILVSLLERLRYFYLAMNKHIEQIEY